MTRNFILWLSAAFLFSLIASGVWINFQAEILLPGSVLFISTLVGYLLTRKSLFSSMRMLMTAISLLTLSKVILIALMLVFASFYEKLDLRVFAASTILHYLLFTSIETGFLYRESQNSQVKS
ncbi:MAG: hypothetical protein J0L62_10105 [Bacteroidetes bacterium]|nr:hypothetical protein [Bacteroidota bacterium]